MPLFRTTGQKKCANEDDVVHVVNVPNMGDKYVGCRVTNESGGRLAKRDEGKERW